MTRPFLLLPAPRMLELTPGDYALPKESLILLDSAQPQALRFTAGRFQAALQKRFGLSWETAAGWAIPSKQVGLVLQLAPQEVRHPQGYQLSITSGGIFIQGHDPAGLFYGVCTLEQIVAQCADQRLPCLKIEDRPDFPVRGVMLDVSRDKVPQLQTLFDLVDRLASWKYNQFQLYTEHTFAYRNHPEPWEHASPVTGQDILRLDAFCRERHVELVPNQNAFGHMHRWLKLEPYQHLAETHATFPVPWGTHQGPFSLAPAHPGSLKLVRELFDELLPHFSSGMVNVGADETHDVGHGQSKELVAQKGAGRVYLDFLLQLYADVSRRGYTMQFWGDIVNMHPELVPEIPRDVIALPWGYEADHPFDVEAARFEAAGLPFYVCPGTSAWNSLAGRTDNAINNLLNAAENGLKHGASGLLNTDWGDSGHWQVLPVSFLGFAAGAGYSWCLEANRSMDVAAVLSRFAFEDAGGAAGKAAYDLGNVYQAPGIIIPNSSALFWLLRWPLDEIAKYSETVSPVDLNNTLDAITQAAQPLKDARMQRPDAALIRQEFDNTVRLMRHACRRGQLALMARNSAESSALCRELHADMQEILAEYERLWLARNRPGGLQDSTQVFRSLLAEYQAG